MMSVTSQEAEAAALFVGGTFPMEARMLPDLIYWILPEQQSFELCSQERNEGRV